MRSLIAALALLTAACSGTGLETQGQQNERYIEFCEANHPTDPLLDCMFGLHCLEQPASCDNFAEYRNDIIEGGDVDIDIEVDR